MTHYSVETATRVLDLLIEYPSLANAARSIGANEKILFVWMRQAALDKQRFAASEISDSKWRFSWPDDSAEPEFFCDHVATARKLFVLHADGEARESLRGTPRVVLDGSGKPTWEIDTLVAAHAIEMDDAMWALTYGDRKRSDIFKRDERGGLIPVVVYDPPPAAWRIHAMRSILPSLWNPSDKKEVDATVSGRVLILGGAEPKASTPMQRDLEARLAQIRERGPEHAQPEGRVEVFKDQRIVDGTEPDNPPRPALPPPEPKTLRDHPRAYEVPKAEPVKRAPPPPPQAYARPEPANIDRAGYGRGTVPPGGFKVA